MKNITWPILSSIVLLQSIIHIIFILSQNRHRITIDVIIVVTAFYGLSELFIENKMKNINE